MELRRSRLLVEVVVLFLGVLAAFALDSWWDRQDERRLLLLELENVRADLVATIEHTTPFVGMHRKVVANVEALLPLMREAHDAGRSTLTVPDTLALGLILSGTTNPPLGGIRILVNSGRIALVRNGHLRAALSGWEDFVSDAVEDEVRSREFLFDQLYPELFKSDSQSLDNLLRRNAQWWNRVSPVYGSGEAGVLAPEPFALSADPVLQNMAILRRAFAVATLDEFGAFLDEAERMIGLVDAEIER